MSKFCVRIAPSPSGALHIGNAKTALFNFLFAKKYDSAFLLRIEDTDQSRAVKNGAENILADLVWLGIIPDTGFGTDNKPAGVYTQMERLSIYQKVAYQLIEKGLAYKCYCTQEDLDKKREEALAKNPKEPFKYPGTCRAITDNLDKPFVIRFKAPTEGYTKFTDITFGERSIPNKENYDFVILRQNGIPLYNFAVVCDDGITDHITHVIRGSDHVKNMVSQCLLYNALDLPLPVFCHLPMLMNKDNQKLSKRDGSVSVAEYRNAGYSPAAILNYLAKFGWGYGNQELFSLNDLIDKFTLEACHCRDGRFDPIKFASINYSHLKSEELTPTDVYAKHLAALMNAKGAKVNEEQLKPFIPVIRSRAKTFVEAAAFVEPMLNDIAAPADLMQKTFNEINTEYLKSLKDILSNLDNWDEESLRTNIQHWLTTHNLSLRDVGGPLRVAILGTANSPEIFQIMNALGKTTSINRITNTLTKLQTNVN